jgi:DNA helicase-2/ATP-dependent DNA helicase PcrA
MSGATIDGQPLLAGSRQQARGASAPPTPESSPPTLESLWADQDFKPNDQQREAIRATAGPLYLTAGPGSGKTSVLVWRTLNLIVFQNVPPERIFLGTFTEKGAHQLRERLRGLLAVVTEQTNKPYDISQMAVGTIHSICHKLLTDRRLLPPGIRPRPPILLDEFEQYHFLYRPKNWTCLLEASELGPNANAQITNFFEKRQSISRHRAVVNAMSFFNRMSEEALDLSSQRPSDPVVRGLLKMYAAYRALLEEHPDRKYTDLSLIQSHAYRRISDSEAGDQLFDHIIVDEYQDTNAIQERIYFRLAARTKNLCVVGDDDQALYRFRGATVDNFLAFPDRCNQLLHAPATRIPLAANYRSRKQIVSFYNEFMRQFSWSRGAQKFRVEKSIEATSKDARPSVFAATPAVPAVVADEVAASVKSLLDAGRVKDPSEIAFLFPSLGSACVEKMKVALEAVGLKVYAPRAGSFIEQVESRKVFGLYLLIFGAPDHQHREYADWMTRASSLAKDLVRADRGLAQFVKDRQDEILRAVQDERALVEALSSRGISEEQECPVANASVLGATAGISPGVRSFLVSRRLEHYIREQKRRRPERPITYRYLINRACSLNWGVLDLFYRLTAFDTFKEAFDSAASGIDEGPICNLSLISDYLARFQEQTSPVISAQFLSGTKFARKLFSSFLYSIFRLDEGEYEDKEDPFPKGRIPFLTVHQAKGLEFPVVVLGNLRAGGGERVMDRVAVELGAQRLEPADIAPTFDMARMFYVALSRAKQALILCPFKGRGQRYCDEFKGPMGRIASPLSELDVKTIEPTDAAEGAVPHPYSFTGDYIQYTICPRRYMLHRRYEFAPSRSQTMIFGNLVHRTIEDLHQFLIHARGEREAGVGK